MYEEIKSAVVFKASGSTEENPKLSKNTADFATSSGAKCAGVRQGVAASHRLPLRSYVFDPLEIVGEAVDYVDGDEFWYFIRMPLINKPLHKIQFLAR